MYPYQDVCLTEIIPDQAWMLFAVHFKFLDNKIQIKQLVKQETSGDIKGAVKDREGGTCKVSKKPCVMGAVKNVSYPNEPALI